MNARKLFGLIVVITLVTLALVSVTNAQGPKPRAPRDNAGTAFTYQGYLKDNGSPANGTYDFLFDLYDATSYGNLKGTASAPDVTVTNGYFTTPIDFGANAFNGEARWLFIRVRPGASNGAYTGLSPFQPLTPAPIALSLPGLYTQQTAISPNLIGGYSGNDVAASIWGATIGGGGAIAEINYVSDNSGTIGGGRKNTAGNSNATATDADDATVGGGYGNVASNKLATVGGGYLNTASGARATVGGGYSNTASGTGAFVGGGGYDGVLEHGGNQAVGNASTIGGGVVNTASGARATVGGGNNNTASGDAAFVGGGAFNTASGAHATVGGGTDNTASGMFPTVGGGQLNTASGWGAFVGGGQFNTASGVLATVPGGTSNTASGNYSFAAGNRAKANADGNFTFADSNDFDFTSTTANSFRVRATGGVRFVLGIDGNGATTWSCSVSNGGSWSCSSDRNLKENFVAVNSRTTLERLSQVPILQWNAKGTDPHIKHFGPMAQDFYAAFGLGDDDKSINTIDLDGVALSSIQGLYAMAQQKDAQIAAQQKQIDSLEARLTALEQQAGNPNAAPNSQTAMLGAGALVLFGIVYRERHANRGAR